VQYYAYALGLFIEIAAVYVSLSASTIHDADGALARATVGCIPFRVRIFHRSRFDESETALIAIRVIQDFIEASLD
jgi:hypothetical protein